MRAAILCMLLTRAHAATLGSRSSPYFTAAQLSNVSKCSDISSACRRCDSFEHCKTRPDRTCAEPPPACSECVGYLGRMYYEDVELCTGSTSGKEEARIHLLQGRTHRTSAKELELAVLLAEDLSGKDVETSIVPILLVVVISLSACCCWLCCVVYAIRACREMNRKALSTRWTEMTSSAVDHEGASGAPSSGAMRTVVPHGLATRGALGSPQAPQAPWGPWYEVGPKATSTSPSVGSALQGG